MDDNAVFDEFWERNRWTAADEAEWRQQQPFFTQIKWRMLELYWDFLYAWHAIADATGLRRFMTIYKLKLGAAGLG